MKIIIRAGRVITPHHDISPGEVLIENHRIIGVGKPGFSGLSDAATVDLTKYTLIPGMIDIHNHGGLGAWVGGNPEAPVNMAKYLPSTGTTGWLPTVGSLDAVTNVAAAHKTLKGMDGGDEGFARLLGIHMEGPFLAPKNLPGDEPKEPPYADIDLLHKIVAEGEGLVKLVGVAPELPNALPFIRELRALGITAAVAHTKAQYDLFKEAVIAGLNHVTHSYNVMTGLHHRRPGVVGGVLTEDSLTCELISDGYHVHPVAMQVLIRCKGPDRICMITDNVHLAGMPDGTYGDAVKKDGMIRRAGYSEDTDGTLCGSAWPANHNLSVLVNKVGVCLADAVKMACLTPAKVIGVDRHKGSIEPGKDADLVALDDGFAVHWTMVEGKAAYSKPD